MSDRRYFSNRFEEYNDSFILNDKCLSPEHLGKQIKHIYQHWKVCLQSNLDYSNISVYSGLSGAALLYLKIFDSDFDSSLDMNKGESLEKADDILKKCFETKNKTRYTLLCGISGVLTIQILINYRSGKTYQRYLQELVSFDENLKDNNLPDELFNGRVGYLYSLILIRSEIPESKNIIYDSIIRGQIEFILRSGQQTASNLKHKSNPLSYYWHDKFYIGAAHGLTGILYILLESYPFLKEDELKNLIKPSVDFILSLHFPSGNYPSSLGKDEDKLVHWCHGSPGIIHLLLLAHKHFGDTKYLQAAVQAGDDIWKRGLLKKGHGLCHGVAGNGYAFLRLYQSTNSQEYLYKALKFAEWCCHGEEHEEYSVQRSISLYEGLAGKIHFLIDVLNPETAKFPAFQV